MNRLSRTSALKIAALLSAAIGVAVLLQAIPLLTRGAASLDASVDSPPFAIVVFGLVMGLVRLASAYGVWFGQRWAIVITVIVNALDALAAVPGVLVGPSPTWQLISLASVILSGLVVVLCLWRDRKPVVAHD